MALYDFNQHRHNYAIWTAARAVQRNFTTTENIKKAIESSPLRSFVEDNLTYKTEDFEVFHRKCAHQLIKALEKKGAKKVSYGRVSKIIAIYLKTSVVLCSQGDGLKSKIIHPPIDSILLDKLSKENKASALKSYRWTKLKEKDYWELVSKIRKHFNKFDWTIEEFWAP